MKSPDSDNNNVVTAPPPSPGRFQINSVKTRRPSNVRFVQGDNVS